MKPTSLIFDCDPGDDDAVALLMAHASPEKIKLLGITTSSGNVSVEKTFKNARDVCALAGRGDVKVYKGSDRPLKKDPFHVEFFHGESGIGGYEFTPSQAPKESKSAIDFIVETILTYPEKITLAVTGPITNIALAYLKEPRIKDNIEKIVIMSGARREKGNITPVAEFNAWVDPHGLQEVLDTFTNVVMVSLDISHQVIIRQEALDKYKAIDSEVGTAVWSIVGHSLKQDMELCELPGRAINDACVTAYILHPEYFSGRNCRVDVECESPLTIGQTVVNWHEFHNKNHQPNCLFLDQVQSDKTLRLIWDKIASYRDRDRAQMV